jgi:hypothetical protein
MSGYYTGLACLVLFDARGPPSDEAHHIYTALTLCTTIILLSLKYLPTIIHRPQQLMDELCNDILCVTAHAACISTLVTEPGLRHGCALHSACFILQQLFMGRIPTAATWTVVHTILVLLLLAAYTHGPWTPCISDVRQFMLSAVCPHALELLAQLLTNAHRVAVIMVSWRVAEE